MVINHDLEKDVTLSALSTGEPLVYILCFIYFIVGILLLLESRRIYRNSKHDLDRKPLYFRLTILNLSTLSMFWRGVLTFVTPNYPNFFSVNIVETFLPLYFQFSSFLLFVFFFSTRLYSILHRKSRIRKFLFPVYLVMEILALIFGVLACAFGTLFDKKINFLDFEDGNLAFTGFLLSTLSVVLSIFCVVSWRLTSKIKLTEIRKEQLRSITILIFINISLFIIHGIWDLCTVSGHNSANDKLDSWYEKKSQNFYWVYFFWYLIFQAFPAFALFIIFHLNLTNEIFQKEELRSLLSDNYQINRAHKKKTFLDWIGLFCFCYPFKNSAKRNSIAIEDPRHISKTDKKRLNDMYSSEIETDSNSGSDSEVTFDPNDLLYD
ncbi:hypothetical protein M0813_11296 [Anaeramoeba flamelloides]|uniref:THH1/TOM1/TOM3 domain-containing protein n=1 Tax=Anaeramoeba flamelloides TaxID=1746091 RepID=A0AAV8AI47_9EUKA|nr:hypothetical protein M0812_03836 [Anaeramoeba flamelloides]KAJ6255420.1 hypothetical protein M0813_11296 [Anaeramoeba flamelloides]